MKIKLLTLAAIAVLFSKNTSDEMEISQDDAQKLNDELQSRADKITQITTERDTLKSNVDTLTTERDNLKLQVDTLTSEKKSAEDLLTTSKNRVTELETENKVLRELPGAESAVAKKETDDVNADNTVDFCKSHSMAENVAYLREQKKKK